MIGFRHADNRFPPLWETNAQPAARWHAAAQGPVQYFAGTPDGARAEFLRHEEITDPADLATVERAMWAVDLPEAGYADVELSLAELAGGLDTYTTCQAEAARLRTRGGRPAFGPRQVR